LPRANAIIGAVAHKAFRGRTPEEYADKLSPGGLFVDVKGMVGMEELRALGVTTWRL
jgi:UDP-N-acetyl-D-galactosamine dehydrogenase